MGAVATYLVGLGLLGLTLHIQADLPATIKIMAALMIVVFLIPLTFHQLVPDSLIERTFVWIILAFLPVAGLLIIPDAFASVNIDDTEDTSGIIILIIDNISTLLYATTIGVVGYISWNMIQIWKNK